MKQVNCSALAALCAALAVAGCTPDDGTPGQTPTGPGRGLEGARVSTRMVERVSVPGSPLPPFERERDLAGPFRRGVALDRGGIRLAEAASPLVLAGPPAQNRRQTRVFEHTDNRAGNRHRLEVERAGPGAPVSRVVAKVNGRIRVALDLSWERRGEVWMLTAQEAEVFDSTGRAIHFRADLTGTTLARSGPMRGATMALGRSLMGALAPQEAWAAKACWQEYAAYVLATGLLAVATEYAILTPEKVSALIGWTLAWEKWQQALNKLLACLNQDLLMAGY